MAQGTTSKPYFFSWPLNPEQVDQMEQTFQKIFQALGSQNHYLATSFANTTSVQLSHNFGLYPIVQVLDLTGLVVAPASITHLNVNTLVVTFAASSSGTIVLSA